MIAARWRRMKQWEYTSTQYLEMSVHLHAPSVYPQYLLYRRLGRSQSRSGRREKENVLFPGIELQFLGRLTRSLVSTGIKDWTTRVARVLNSVNLTRLLSKVVHTFSGMFWLALGWWGYKVLQFGVGHIQRHVAALLLFRYDVTLECLKLKLYKRLSH